MEPQNNGETVKTVFPIEGVTCTACAHSIEHALSRKKGVLSAKVNFANEKAAILRRTIILPSYRS